MSTITFYRAFPPAFFVPSSIARGDDGGGGDACFGGGDGSALILTIGCLLWTAGSME